MKKSDPTELHAETWGLSQRAAKRWFENGAPLDRWMAVNDWHAHLSDKTACKLSARFMENVYLASELRTNPRPGTAQAGIWLAAIEREQELGARLPMMPQSWSAWIDEGVGYQIKEPHRGISAANCKTFCDWFHFFGNRPFFPDEFAMPGRDWAPPTRTDKGPFAPWEKSPTWPAKKLATGAA